MDFKHYRRGTLDGTLLRYTNDHSVPKSAGRRVGAHALVLDGDDPYEIGRLLCAADLELTRLACGSVFAHVVSTQLVDTCITVARCESAVVIRGCTPAGRTSVITASTSELPARIGPSVISGEACAILGGKSTLDLFVPGHCDILIVSIPSSRYDARLRHRVGRAKLPPAARCVFVAQTRDAVSAVTGIGERVADWAQRGARAATTHDFRRREEKLVLDTVARLLEGPGYNEYDRVSTRHRAVSEARSYIHQHLAQHIGLAELCRVAKVRARTLEYGFGEAYGVSPITYIRCAKLSRVHHVLQGMDPRATSIARSAAAWGFVHMGQFAKDYRTLFGESPSDTLRGSSGSKAD